MSCSSVEFPRFLRFSARMRFALPGVLACYAGLGLWALAGVS